MLGSARAMRPASSKGGGRTSPGKLAWSKTSEVEAGEAQLTIKALEGRAAPGRKGAPGQLKGQGRRRLRQLKITTWVAARSSSTLDQGRPAHLQIVIKLAAPCSGNWQQRHGETICATARTPAGAGRVPFADAGRPHRCPALPGGNRAIAAWGCRPTGPIPRAAVELLGGLPERMLRVQMAAATAGPQTAGAHQPAHQHHRDEPQGGRRAQGASMRRPR